MMKANDPLLSRAEIISDRRSVDTGDGCIAILDDHTVLNIDTFDLGEGSIIGAIVGNELSDNGHFLRGVNSCTCAFPCQGLKPYKTTEDVYTRSVERSIAHAIRVEVAAILVTNAGIAIARARKEPTKPMRKIYGGLKRTHHHHSRCHYTQSAPLRCRREE